MKYTATGVILDQEQAKYVFDALKLPDASKVALARAKAIALENGLADIEITEDRYYSVSARMEIILCEKE